MQQVQANTASTEELRKSNPGERSPETARFQDGVAEPARAQRGGASGTRPGTRAGSRRLRACVRAGGGDARARGGGGFCRAPSCSRGAGRVREDGGPGECRPGSPGSSRGRRARGHSEVRAARGGGMKLSHGALEERGHGAALEARGGPVAGD